MNPILAWTIAGGLFLVAVLATVLPSQGLKDNATAQQVYAEVDAIHNAMAPKYAAKAQRYGTTAFTYANLTTLSAIPTTLVGPGNTLQNKWGGSVVVTGATAFLYIDYNGVPAEDCTNLLSQIPSSSTIVNTAAATSEAGLAAATVQATSIDPIAAGALCTTASNSIRFIVGL